MTTDTRHVILIGPMGAGKTTLGRELAAILDRVFFDSDAYIAEHYVATGRQLVERVGVSRLHEVEREALRFAMNSDSPAVIAAAASVADHVDALAATSSAYLVYLDADPEALAGLAEGGAHRRSIDESEAKTLHARRRSNALAAGAVLFPVSRSRSPQDSAAALLALLDD